MDSRIDTQEYMNWKASLFPGTSLAGSSKAKTRVWEDNEAALKSMNAGQGLSSSFFFFLIPGIVPGMQEYSTNLLNKLDDKKNLPKKRHGGRT